MENREILLLDGAMGTMLQSAGLPMGQIPELWNLTHPEAVTAVHRAYVEAGSRVIYTNTFGANRYKTAGCGADVGELVAAGVKCARAAAEPGVRVALDVGPIGQLLEPLGTLTFEDAYETFRQIVRAGKDAGADLVVFETMSDLYEAKAAVLAAKENSDLPVWVTMTFEATGRTFVGTTVASMALTLSGLGADALGFNCSLGPKDLIPLAEELRRWTDLPTILKPNAGLPDPATGKYAVSPETFAEELCQAAKAGVAVVGGCCGTTPEHIRAAAELLRSVSAQKTASPTVTGVCSATHVTPFDGVRVVGERINPTGKKRFQQALRESDLDYITRQGVEQQDAGADVLDVNVGLPEVDEPAMMTAVVKALQTVTDLPLQIDSSDPAAIEAGLRAANGKAIVNSVNGKKAVLDAVLPICKKYGAAVIGLCMDENGIPATWRQRAEIARRILDAAVSYGIPREDVIIDCLTLTVSAQQEQAAETLRAVRYVTEELGLHTTLGVSNISFGLPSRETVNASFLTAAMEAGLDLPILNPNSAAMMDAVAAYRVLSGQDRNSESYIVRFSAAPKPEPTAPAAEMSVEEAVARGMGAQVAAATEKALAAMDEMEVINRLLIPALDRVGERYEKQEIFLPQLITAASAACRGFDVVKSSLARRGRGSLSKGKIVLATVQGDIHDIGKNIVAVVLENYGYTVVDLGRDVPPQTVVEAVRRENAPMLGLSALMTTTVVSMAETIAAVRKDGLDCKIMVGGAVLTEDYARQIGADYYAKDAKQAADIAKKVFS